MISVLVPTYNEAGNIAPLLRGLREALAGREAEVLVCDDDSPDGTWRLAEAESAAWPAVRVLRRRRPQRGLAGALAEAFAASRGRIVAWLDGDGSAPPALLPRLVAEVERGADLAAASRYVPGGRDLRPEPLRRWASRAVCALAAAALGGPFRDYTSGYAAARRELLEALGFTGTHGEYFIALAARARRSGRKLVEVPYELLPRGSGASKTDAAFARHAARYLAAIARLRAEAYRPGGAL